MSNHDQILLAADRLIHLGVPGKYAIPTASALHLEATSDGFTGAMMRTYAGAHPEFFLLEPFRRLYVQDEELRIQVLVQLSGRGVETDVIKRYFEEPELGHQPSTVLNLVLDDPPDDWDDFLEASRRLIFETVKKHVFPHG